jgi:hypothetical protein
MQTDIYEMPTIIIIIIIIATIIIKLNERNLELPRPGAWANGPADFSSVLACVLLQSSRLVNTYGFTYAFRAKFILVWAPGQSKCGGP